jgi:hypothetical protein
MMDYLNDLKIALADLRARYPIGEQPPPLVLARILELGSLIAWASKQVNRRKDDSRREINALTLYVHKATIS